MEFEFKQTRTDDVSIRKYAELLSAVFPKTSKYTFDFLKWQYLDNPHGQVVGYDAYYGNQLAAHYVTIPVEYKKNNILYKGLLSLNTATSKEFQGKGLFTKLAERTYQLGEQLGYEYVIGVANQNSTHGFINKLGFQLISPLDAYVFVFDNANMPIRNDLFRSNWNEETLKWRLKNPVNKYLYRNDLIFSTTDHSFINACLSFQEKRPNPTDVKLCLKMSIGLNNIPSNLIKIKIPNRFKPSPLNLIFKPLKSFDLKVNKKNIYFELLDFDAY